MSSVDFASRWLLSVGLILPWGCMNPTKDSGPTAHPTQFSNELFEETVRAFRAAKTRNDYEAARAYLSSDPRVWYESRSGDGRPWTLGEGRWKHWDKYFEGRSEEIGEWHVDGQRVWVDVFETNDYFRLLDRPGGYFRLTYFLTDEQKIEGYMISGVPWPLPWTEAERMGRTDEFRTWALQHAREESAYLMPDGSIDPTEDRPQRMRALLERWRNAVGLPAIE